MSLIRGSRFAPAGWLVALLAVGRVALTLRAGSVSGDDIKQMLDFSNWWRHGDAWSMFAVDSSAGIVYAGFHNFPWAALAGLFSFALGPLFLAHGLLLALPALLIVREVPGPSGRWGALLALSSPLLAYFSLSLLTLWWISCWGGFFALAAAASHMKGRPWSPRSLLVLGVFEGYLCGVYPSLAPLALGILLWLAAARYPRRSILGFLAGCGAGLIPYLWLLASRRSQLAPHVQVGHGPFSPLDYAGGVFRFLGLPSTTTMNVEGAWAAAEHLLQAITPFLWLACTLAWLLALARCRRRARPVPAIVALAGYSCLGFLLFTAATRTESWFHQAINLWWIPAIVLPWAIGELRPASTNRLLALLLGFNLACLLVSMGPRFWLGTTTERAYETRGRGPSWWMQEEMADKIASLGERRRQAGLTEPLAVKADPIYFLQFSLPSLFRIQHPDLEDTVKWVAEGIERADLHVCRDGGCPNRLRLAVAPSEWLRPAQPWRRLLALTSSAANHSRVQIPLTVDPSWVRSLEILDVKGQEVRYYADPPVRGRATLWLRFDALTAGQQFFDLYYGGERRSDEGPSRGAAVFDYFEDFRHADMARWTREGAGIWVPGAGGLGIGAPATEADATSGLLLAPYPPDATGVVEARLRFLTFPTETDVGIAFAARPGQHSFLWLTQGNGATTLAGTDPHGTPSTLAWTNWYWKPVANRWSTIGAEWEAGVIKATLDGRVIIDTIDQADPGFGRFGLAVKRGTGAPVAEADWVRLRRTPAPGSWALDLEPPERMAAP